jgi:hypothetical protein
MTSDYLVDPDGLRRCSTGLADTAARVRARLATTPLPGSTAPGWAVTGGVEELTDAVHAQFMSIAEAVAAVGRQIATAADDYDAADERAAARLRAVR